MKDILLDDNDEIVIDKLDFTIIDSLDYLRQKLKIRLRFFLGEYYLDINKGIPFFDRILIKNPDIDDVESIFKAEILGTKGVKELTSFDMNFDTTKRQLSISFKALTTAGLLQFEEAII